MTTLIAACGVDAPPTVTLDDSPVPGVDEPSADEGADAPPTHPIYWATNAVADEAGSTHLWIVDRAGDVLGHHAEGVRARNWLLNATCKPRWQQALYDADYRAKYNGGWFDLTPTSSTVTIGLSGATWASHFYDPDSGKNYKGQSSPTAKTEALAHSGSARTLLAQGDLYNGCYELGLALHYFTDLTQPMHASNYTATNLPTSLHTHVEEYALNLQTGGAPSGWTAPSGTTAQFIDTAGRRSKAQWLPLKSAIASVYGARCWPFSTYILDHTDCWQGDPTVDTKIRSSMASAINDTASFLISIQLP